MDFTRIKPYPSDCASVPDTYYSLGEDCIVVRKYLPSRLESGSVAIAQDISPSSEPVFYFENDYFDNLALLVDDDESVISDMMEVYSGDIRVKIDRDEYEPACNHGYIMLAGPFLKGSRIVLSKVPELKNSETEAPAEAAVPEAVRDSSEAEVPEEAAEPEAVNDAAEAEVSEEAAVPEIIAAVAVTREETAEDTTEKEIVGETTESVTFEEAVESAEEIDNYEDEEVDDPVDEEDEDLEDEEIDDLEDEEDDDLVDEEIDDLEDEEDDDLADEEVDDLEDEEVEDAAHFSQSFDEAKIFYSEKKKRYVLKISDGAGAHAILPDGTEIFAKADPDAAFKGYIMKTSKGESDLVVMREKALTSKARNCHAYMRTLGSFSGDCCYCVDVAHPEKNGTHGTRPGYNRIDPETGYKWGALSESEYEFELEDGYYNVYTIYTREDGSIDSKQNIQRVTNGFLNLSCEGRFTNISINAADNVISEYGTYTSLVSGSLVKEAAFLTAPEPVLQLSAHNADIGVLEEETSEAESPDIDTTAEVSVVEASSEDTALGASVSDESSEDSVLEASFSERSAEVDTFNFQPLIADPGAAVVHADPPEEPDEDTEDEPVHIPVIPKPVGKNIQKPTWKQISEPAQQKNTGTADEEPKKVRIASFMNSQDDSPRIRISTYSNSPDTKQTKDAARHLSNTLKTKQAKNAATAAGVAVGAALLGGIIKALSGRRK